jgi:ubiquinone/menaquinone biosynthesis C-methylase UbiE
LQTKNKKDRYAFRWDKFRDTTMGQYLLRQEQAFLNRCLKNGREPQRILDVGCGSGRMTLPLHSRGFRVTGIDMNSVALNTLRQISDDIPIVMGDALRLPYADGSFELAVATQFIDYVPYRPALHEFWRVLSPGGLLVFDALNRDSYRWFVKIVSRRRLALPSANLSYREILGGLMNTGFSIESIRGYNWVPFPRTSNSRLVGVAELGERSLLLPHLSRISPKVLIAARKEAVD